MCNCEAHIIRTVITCTAFPFLSSLLAALEDQPSIGTLVWAVINIVCLCLSKLHLFLSCMIHGLHSMNNGYAGVTPS